MILLARIFAPKMFESLSKLRTFFKYLSITIKDDTFLQDYLHQSELITVHHDKKTIRQFLLIFCLIAVGVGHFFCLASPASLTSRSRILLYDLIYFLFQKAALDIFGGLAFLTAIYSSWAFYFRPAGCNNRLLKILVLKQQSSVFFLPELERGTGRTQRRPICRRIRARLFVLARLIHLFPLSFNTLLFLTHPLLLYKCHQLFYSYPSVLYYGALLLCTINGLLLMDLPMFIYCFFVWIILTVASIQLYILILKLRQLNRYLSRSAMKQQNFELCYRRYHSHLIEVLHYFIEYNHLYGQLFFIFLLVNCPLNAYLMIQILFDARLSFLAATYLYVYGAVEIFGLFALHYALMSFSTHFHGSAHQLQSLMVKTRLPNSRSRIQLAALTMAINSKERYGVTYGKFGLVTLNTFAKFLVFYSKALMIVYKMTRY